MILKSIELCNFRNYKREIFKFHPGTNVLYGDNAQGKTNVLEAIFVGGTTKSHRGSKDAEMIRKGQRDAHLRYFVEKRNRTIKVEIHMKKERSKGIAIDGLPIKNSNELMGISNIIFFSPEDLNIIKNGPAERRRFLDSELCQLDRIYLADLTNYNKILAQRNKLLKDMIYRPSLSDTLPVWDMQLIETGKKIIRRRKQFVDELREIVSDIHYRISGGKEELFLKYEPNIDDIFFEDELSRAKEKDKKLCQTSVGPHRDDLLFSIGNVDIRKYGSQGQQRTSALSLKLSEIELVRKSISDTPVLLLDDVLSELDSSRQNYLLNNISDTQTIITCTGLDEFVNHRFSINKVFHIQDGTVAKEN